MHGGNEYWVNVEASEGEGNEPGYQHPNMRLLTGTPPAQNPVSVKVREEVVRLTKKIKTAEAELLLKRGQGERQVQTIAKLQEDLDKINSGKS